MIDDFNQAVDAYNAKWQQLIKNRKDAAFFRALKPVALGWKVADRVEYDKLYAALHDQADKIIETWMNGRWVAKIHLRDASLNGGIVLIKLMERRPGSTDAVGLDHVDFHSPQVAQAEQVLEKEVDLKWSRESNDVVAGYDWISIWFDGTEAKIKADTVLDIIGIELEELNKHIKGDQ